MGYRQAPSTRWLNSRNAAAFVGISREEFMRAVLDGRVGGFREITKDMRFHRSALIRFMEGRECP